MDAEEREKIEKEISSRIAETKRTIESLRGQIAPVEPDRAIGRITRMDAIQQKSMAEANLRTAEQTLYNLEEALTKLGESDFGLCIRCGQSIPLERILAMPASKCCVQCA